MWPTKKLMEVCDIVYGFAFKASAFNETGKGLPVIRIGDVDKSKTNKFFDGKYDEKYLVKKDDVLLGLSGSFKAFRWEGDTALLNQRVATLRNFENEVAKKFVFYQMPRLFFELEKQITQLSVKNILAKHLNNLNILYPPLKIQQKIVERLDAIKRAQELNDKQIELAEELFQSLLHRELDQKGKNWEVKKLGEVTVFKRGPFGGSLKKEIFVERGYKVYEQKNVINNDFTIGNYFINEKKYREMIDFAIHPSDLIISCSGTIGKVVKVPEKVHPGIINQALLKITPLKNIIIGDFLKFVIETSVIQERLTANTRGSAIRNVASVKEIKRIKIPLPPIEEQRKIVEKLSAVQNYKKKLIAQKQKLQELFESVLNKSMKGELVK